MSAILSLDAAQTRILATLTPVNEVEILELHALPERFLAEAIDAPRNVPPADNSAMDGYALRAADLPQGATPDTAPVLKLIGRAMAGEPFEGDLGPGQCVRIMTGAVMPRGADTVVMQENVVRDGENISLIHPPKPQANVRYAGEDIAQGEGILAAGHRIRPMDLGLLASLGIATAKVRRRLKVAVFSNGNELRAPGTRLQPGQIYDSNRYFLTAMLKKMACEVIDLGVAPDQLEALRDTFQRADQQADVIISCGGASVGEADYTGRVLRELGRVEFWKVAIKPGKPFIYGALGSSRFFGLPGNPSSALLTFHQLVVPALVTLQGGAYQAPVKLRARTQTDLRPNRSRLEFLRAQVAHNDKGDLVALADHQQSSGALSAYVRANAYILLAPGKDIIEAGNWVEIQLFSAPLI